MTDPQVERDPNLKAIVERFIAAFRPERIYLFGSKARGAYEAVFARLPAEARP
jgi:predicted nucleotidyltransferase